MPRKWPAPLRSDNTLHCIGDTHFGARAPEIPQFDRRRQQIVERDLAKLAVPAYRLQLGDLTDNAYATDDATGVAWMQSLGGTPLYTVGNHDMYGGRTAAAAAAAWGAPGKDYVQDLGYAKLIVLGPDELHPGNSTGVRYSTTALNFLDAALTAAGSTPCLIAAHAPLRNTVGFGAGTDQYRSTDQYFYAADDASYSVDTGIRAVLAAHNNAKAWISGHTHSPVTSPRIVYGETIGSHTLVHVNTSCLAYTGKVKTDWFSRLVTFYLTVADNRITVRFRDHGAGQWVGGGPDANRNWAVTL